MFFCILKVRSSFEDRFLKSRNSINIFLVGKQDNLIDYVFKKCSGNSIDWNIMTKVTVL